MVRSSKMRFTSQTYNPVTGKYANTYEDGTMTIQRRSSASDSWRTIGTMAIKSVEADSDTYTDVDISGLLNSGTCPITYHCNRRPNTKHHNLCSVPKC